VHPTPVFARDGSSLLDSRIAGDLHALRQDLDTLHPQIRAAFPEAAFSNTLRALPLTAAYHFVPRKLRKNAETIHSAYGEQAASLYHRLILCFLIHESLPFLTSGRASLSSIGANGYPEPVIAYYYRHFDWIARNILENPEFPRDYFNYDNDLFVKDLSVASLRMFPAGAHVVEQLWVSTQFITHHGLLNFLKASHFYFHKMKGGNTPFYHVHLEDRWVIDFTRAGWLSFFRLTAHMLRNHPEVRGVFGSSWFYDPSLEKISPGLLYLRKVPELGGAKIFRLGSTFQDIENATHTSERRKALHQEGKYLPTRYLFIWSRDDLIRWADKVTEPMNQVHGSPGLKSFSLN
jgi:hypothetical protein